MIRKDSETSLSKEETKNLLYNLLHTEKIDLPDTRGYTFTREKGKLIVDVPELNEDEIFT